MGLFEKMFGKKPISQSETSTTRFEMIVDNGEGFYAWNGNLYKSDIIRAAIRPAVIAIGKLIPRHIRDNSRGMKVFPENHIKRLLKRPNPLMTMQVLQEKMATQLYLNNNAFAYIKRDIETLLPVAIYPLPSSTIEVKEGMYGDIFLKFYFPNGSQQLIAYSDIIHLRRDFNDNDFFSDPPGAALTSLMEVITTSDQGIIKAIKNSAIIRWILKFATVMRDEDVKAAVDKFNDQFLTVQNSGGAAGADGKYELKQVDNKAFVPDDKQAMNTVQRVYSFFNTNDNIVQAKYNEDEWNAYYEMNIEPVAMQFADETTEKLFLDYERNRGDCIIYEASSLQYASMSTKLALVQMVDRGALTPNDWCRILNLPPVEGGDKPIRRLDTVQVTTKSEGGDNDNEGN
ncbi:phage portal protein [Lysinibacillus fusiformis]|uniref:phage portal protein n=1 Tax=Lysinibacillus fusiformis TaxID=28031 RepID=UPI001967EE70|nr:phage portal protein [Lysinibacillus fusiformis]QSB10452.1 phage portal protein [Lysinibacillus fusiformis]